MSMTRDDKRVAIALACGWKKATYASQMLKSESDEDWGFLSPEGLFFGSSVWYLPSYLNDLNAMSKAEKVIINSKDTNWVSRYQRELFRTCGISAITASAEERAEAFLKTI